MTRGLFVLKAIPSQEVLKFTYTFYNFIILYVKFLDGFCFYVISNCIKYSKNEFDENMNPKCEECFHS